MKMKFRKSVVLSPDQKALLIIEGKELVVSSEILAQGFEIPHKNILELVRKYDAQFVAMRQFPFQTRIEKGKRGVPVSFCTINEQQSIFLVSPIGKSPVSQVFGEVSR